MERQRASVVLGIAAGLVVFGLAGPAQAQERLTGFELGGRVGYGVPFGKGASNANSDLNEGIAGQIPLWLDLGARVSPNVMVGGYFSYGFGLLGSGFDESCETVDCRTYDMRLGGQVQFHVQPGQEVDPWLGAGFGYEWLTFNVSDDNTDVSVTGHGFEFLNLQAGLDFVVGNGGMGPFMAFTLGQYDTVTQSCDGTMCLDDEISESIDDKALHQWLFFGARGTFVLGAN